MNKLYYRISFDILKRTFILLPILYLSMNNLTYGQSWTQLTTTGSSPTARYGHTAVFDTTNNKMIIFGGNIGGSHGGTILNDVWVLSNANGLGGIPSWTQITSTGSTPASRVWHTAIYDASNNRMTIFGGNSTGGYLGNMNDVWVLSNANGLGGTSSWTQITSTGNTPINRSSQSAVYDSVNNRMTIFGGSSTLLSSDNMNDVWVLNNANGLDSTTSIWTQLFPTGSIPSTRQGHTAVYDPTNNLMAIFGGVDSNGDYLNDEWILSAANGLGGTPSWTQLSPIGSTSTKRAYHTTVYDAVNNRMTVFGGINGISYLNDVWVLSTANGLAGSPTWTKIFPTGGTPTTRDWHTAVYDNINNRMTIFGGTNPNPPYYLNDIWVLSNSNGQLPSAGFYGTPTNGNGPLQVFFNDTSSFNPTSWNWNFGDGGTTGFTFSSFTNHIYGSVTISTSYTVQLIVSNQFGISTSTQINYIHVIEPGPTASFTGAPLSGYSPLTVYFFDDSYNLYGGSTSWNWNFGDSSTSNIQNPVHIYKTISSITAYTVQLIVTTNFGMNTSIKTNYIVVFPPPAVEDWMLYAVELDKSHSQIFYMKNEND